MQKRLSHRLFWGAQILKFSEDLQLEGVQVRAVGCMAGCGDGPNVAMDPPGVILNHMTTPARFREALQAVGGVAIPPEVLKATELRLAGNAEARGGDLKAAVARYTEVTACGAAGERGRARLLVVDLIWL